MQEAEVQLREHYKPLQARMVKTTQTKVNQIIEKLHRGKHIDDMTKKWLSQTFSPPRIPVFYTLTKIHKPIPVRRPIISGCDCPTKKISSLSEFNAKTKRKYIFHRIKKTIFVTLSVYYLIQGQCNIVRVLFKLLLKYIFFWF